ncbi:transforming growth factor beta-1 proprotein-like [Lepus europaeus]|uniref:transforming growth factor beta-1 proprotein-like n=1 Tax=Lepus europaeus TaxID=9983 RepID=UPI002B46400F|nr:transforming growth factor beta-1 proprotein-like [Lepus europaeus]XP_062032991.1 transforming growth factor beta-1 proprotein-like [Lepus europaeus]XP_062032992.1 transforming growth factor beta-1 proprotein-like [Lepus europaeus]
MAPSAMRLLLPLLWLSVLAPGRPAAGMPGHNATELEKLQRQHLEAYRALLLSKLKVPSPRSLEEEPTSPEPDDVDQSTREQNTEEGPELLPRYLRKEVTRVPMLHSSHEIYKKYQDCGHSVYMLFNMSELRRAVPEPVLLSRAELRLEVLKIQQEQHVELYQKDSSDSWQYIKSRNLEPSDTDEWLSIVVTRVVRTWLSRGEEIEGFRLSTHCSCDSIDDVLQLDINGISSSHRGNHAAAHRMNRPFLLLVATPLKRALQLYGTWHH